MALQAQKGFVTFQKRDPGAIKGGCTVRHTSGYSESDGTKGKQITVNVRGICWLFCKSRTQGLLSTDIGARLSLVAGEVWAE